VRPSVVWLVGLAALPLFVAPSSAAAQSGFHRRWEIPGFDFRKNGAWRVRAQRIADLRHQLIAQRRTAQLNGARLSGPAPSQTQVTGTIQVPVVLFSYLGTGAQFMRDSSQYRQVLFDSLPPGGNPYTLRSFYKEMSNGVFGMLGKVIGWVPLDSGETTYTGVAGTCNGNPFGTTNCNGIFSVAATKRMQDGFRQALARVDTGAAGINFAQFDNDGPDLVPNSGDDDGYVDMIMFAHPTKDGACGGNNSPNPPRDRGEQQPHLVAPIRARERDVDHLSRFCHERSVGRGRHDPDQRLLRHDGVGWRVVLRHDVDHADRHRRARVRACVGTPGPVRHRGCDGRHR
jgi:hypothetical protein